MPPVRDTRSSRLPAWLWPLGCCLLLAACSARGCGEAPDPSEAPVETTTPEVTLPPATLTLAIITDLKGYLEPCGCTSRPLGGIDRVAARIAATRSAGPTLTL